MGLLAFTGVTSKMWNMITAKAAVSCKKKKR